MLITGISGRWICLPRSGFVQQFNQQEPGEIQPFVSVAEYVVALQNLSEDAKTASDPELKSLRNTLKAITENLPEEYEKKSAVRAALKKTRRKLGLK